MATPMGLGTLTILPYCRGGGVADFEEDEFYKAFAVAVDNLITQLETGMHLQPRSLIVR